MKPRPLPHSPEPQTPQTQKVLLSHEECRYRSEDLFFRIIHSHFLHLNNYAKILLHESSLTPIRHFILELERVDEKAFFDHALKSITREYEFISKRNGL